MTFYLGYCFGMLSFYKTCHILEGIGVNEHYIFFSAYAFVDYEDRRDAEVKKFLVIRFQNNSSFFFP